MPSRSTGFVAAFLHSRSDAMAQVLVEFPHIITGEDGVRYHAHACGAAMQDGLWQGWLEFVPIGSGDVVRSSRETTQPNRADATYWATGLTAVNLEDALRRATHPLVVRHVEADVPVFDAPAPRVRIKVDAGFARDAIFDPFAVYQKEGEALLRRHLGALAAWHLVNIVEKYELSSEPPAILDRLPPAALIDRIVSAVGSQRLRTSRR